MSIEDNRKRYEGSSIEALMNDSGHDICKRCYCCDSFGESSPCWSCGGFADDEDGEWPAVCSVCGDEGSVYYNHCAGDCDEEGNHKPTNATLTAGQRPVAVSPVTQFRE